MHRISSSLREPNMWRFTSWRKCPEVAGNAVSATKVSVVQPAASAAVPFFSLRRAVNHCFWAVTASAVSVGGLGVMAGKAVEGVGAHLRCTAAAVSAEWGATPWLHSCFQAGPILPSRAAETSAFAA
eukprot:3687453-Amphidinium_carterae.4